MKDVKSCPCCGSHAKLEMKKVPSKGTATFRVQCQSGKCGMRTGDFQDSEKALSIWNKREK